MTSKVLGKKHEEDVKQANEMKVTSDLLFGNIVDCVGVYMKAMKLKKFNDTFDNVNWFMIKKHERHRHFI